MNTPATHENLLSALVKKNAVTRQQAEEALERSTTTGLPVDTILLEQGVAEDQILDQWAHLLRFEAAPAGRMETPQAAALRLLPQRLAMNYHLFPLQLHQGKLQVAVSRAPAESLTRSLEIVTGVPVEWQAAISLRLAWAQARYYGVPLSAPAQESIQAQAWNMDTVALEHFKPVDLQDYEATDIDWKQVLGDSSPALPGEAPPPSATDRIILEVLSEPLSQDVGVTENMGPAAAAVSAQTLSLTQGIAALDLADNRDAVISTVLQCAQGVFEWCVFFALQKNHLVAFQHVGNPLLRERLNGFSVPLDKPSTLKRAFDGQSQFLGKLPESASLEPLYALASRPVPPNAALFPLILRGKVFGLLYGDNGHNKVEARTLTDLTVLLPHAVQAVDRIIQSKKKT